ncbi:Hint domain-containing protein [Nereida sp. MMG025]|uniref:Hint domain-containing protein n=1 Tax=Nereida sp. MMG025 TaxID=2909981 RepID=UPI001F472056|nr:Hint domain-containing protein [Nereida sp. MMG025]MCF6444925.1 Hint domain-containing protein [Nereida sp. MMG025]
MADPFISEFQTTGDNGNFVEVRVDEGYDVSDLRIAYYNNGGERMQAVNLGAIDGGGATGDVYVISSGPINSARAFALYDRNTGEVFQFVSSGQTINAINGPASGETSDDVGTHTGSQSMQSDDGGQTYYTQSSPNPGSAPPPCFLRGTRIRVPDGWRRVEQLRKGDFVCTNTGPKAIRWIARRAIDFSSHDARDKPWRIRAADGRHVDLSPQHRVFVDLAGRTSGLLPVRLMPHSCQRIGLKRAVYLHLLLDEHSIVDANGFAVETLLIGAQADTILPPNAPRDLSLVPAAPILRRSDLRSQGGAAYPIPFSDLKHQAAA